MIKRMIIPVGTILVTLYTLASFNLGYSQEISPLQEINPLYGEPIYHLVEKGDFLFKIALKYNCSYPSISRANKIKDPNIIRINTELVIPSVMLLPKHEEEGSIIINIPEFRLYHFQTNHGNCKVKVYPICAGLETWQTPRGEFEVINKIKNPTWYMPSEMAERLHIKREILPPGELNPLGDVWVGLNLKHIGIHSTNQPMSIGRPLSHGCVRLYSEGAREFFNSVSFGEKGRIIYEPIKVAIWQEDIYLEVHPDVYQLITDYEKEFLNKCEDLGVDIECLDITEVKIALEERRGIPIVVGRILPKRLEVIE